jgi:tRNA(Ile)-lysidine synthase
VTEGDIVELVRADGLLRRDAPVVVLCSGGRDSVCLLDLAVRIAGADRVTAMHVNYGLRAAADGDERLCRDLTERVGGEFVVRRAGPPPTAGNLQAWARGLRYAEAERLAAARGADVAAGHTATDQAETILYRLATSPSRRALVGMEPRTGRLVRPLLRVTRADTTAYCRERGLPWREDASNATDAYARNRVRSGLLPALRAIHPAAEENVVALAQSLRSEGAVLDALADEVLAGRSEIALARLRELPVALRRLVVQRLADRARGGLAPGIGARADELAGLSERGTVTLDLGHGIRAIAEYGVLRFDARRAAAPAVPAPALLSVPGAVAFGECEVRCAIGPPERAAGVLDRERLGSELLVRTWRDGDRMRPLGLDGSKSLQDLFTARRVPRERRRWLAVVEARGEIAWVPGVATSELFKVTDETVEAAHLTLVEPGHR